jgi:hypothetical protein
MSRVWTMVVALWAFGFMATESWAQGAYVAGGAGMAAGTGGPAPAVVVSAGFQPSPHIGFAVELSVIPQLDFGTRESGPEPLVGFDPQLFFPITTITSSGRLTAVHVNVIVPIATVGKLRLSAIAGGGTASLRTRVHAHRDAFTFPGIPEFDLPGLTLPVQDITRSASATGLALNTGGLVEYALKPNVGVGVDLRYLHTSASRDINIFRGTGHVIWRF